MEVRSYDSTQKDQVIHRLRSKIERLNQEHNDKIKKLNLDLKLKQ
jgi:hypothetical protein